MAGGMAAFQKKQNSNGRALLHSFSGADVHCHDGSGYRDQQRLLQPLRDQAVFEVPSAKTEPAASVRSRRVRPGYAATDALGYQIFPLYGNSLAILFSSVVGGALGAVAGYYGKRLDNILMRFMDILLAIPSMLLAIAIVAALGTSLTNVLIAIGVAYIPVFARTVRASVLMVKEQEFIEAARSIGCNDFTIIFQYIVPNSLATTIVQITLGIAGAILSIAGLSFLGLGIQPPTPEWGAMLSNARTYIRDAWHITIIPGVGIMLTILALNLMGDGLRDALDPRLKN